MTGLLPHLRELQSILERGLWMNNTRFGKVHLFNKEKNTLEIVAHKGFREEFLERIVRSFDSTTCGKALGEGTVVYINDVTSDKNYEPLRSIAEEAGFRSVVSQPLIADGRQVLGVLSMHFRDPRSDWNSLCISPTVNEMVRLIQGAQLSHSA